MSTTYVGIESIGDEELVLEVGKDESEASNLWLVPSSCLTDDEVFEHNKRPVALSALSEAGLAALVEFAAGHWRLNERAIELQREGKERLDADQETEPRPTLHSAHQLLLAPTKKGR